MYLPAAAAQWRLWDRETWNEILSGQWLLNWAALRKPHWAGVCARSWNRECFDVLSSTYGPMGRVLPRWSRPPGPQISLSIVSVPRFPLSPTNRLFLISCLEPSSWGKVPPLRRKSWRWKGCSHPAPTLCPHRLCHTYLAKVRPMPLSANLQRQERCFRRSLGSLWFIMSNCNMQTSGGQQGLITILCSGGTQAFLDLFPLSSFGRSLLAHLAEYADHMKQQTCTWLLQLGLRLWLLATVYLPDKALSLCLMTTHFSLIHKKKSCLSPTPTNFHNLMVLCLTHCASLSSCFTNCFHKKALKGDKKREARLLFHQQEYRDHSFLIKNKAKN